MLVGQALVILPTILSGSSGQALWSWVSVIGFVAFLGGAVQVVTRYCSLDLLPDPAGMTWIGIGSGVVAFGFGLGLEVLSTHLAGWPTTLWLAGPIEEGGKLLVPVLLLAFGPPRFRTPRVGLYLVLVSGATVGVLEGTEYVGRPEFAWAHLEMALVRPSAELLHVFVTGFAAAVIWLAAWRRGRPVTVAGVVAFAVAAGIHSFHDGIITFFHANPRNFDSTLAQTLHDAIDRGLAGAVVALVLAGLLYLLARHAVRELTAPGVVCHCPPPWRPQIKQWGMDPTDTRWASPVPPSTMATAPGYGTPAPDGLPVPLGPRSGRTRYGDPSPHSASHSVGGGGARRRRHRTPGLVSDRRRRRPVGLVDRGDLVRRPAVERLLVAARVTSFHHRGTAGDPSRHGATPSGAGSTTSGRALAGRRRGTPR